MTMSAQIPVTKPKPDYLRWFLSNITAWGVAMGLAASLITFTAFTFDPYTAYYQGLDLDYDWYLAIVWCVALFCIAGMGMLSYWLRQRMYGLPIKRSNLALAGVGGYLALVPIALCSLFVAWGLEFMDASPYFYLSEPYDIIGTEALLLLIVAPIIGSFMALIRINLAS